MLVFRVHVPFSSESNAQKQTRKSLILCDFSRLCNAFRTRRCVITIHRSILPSDSRLPPEIAQKQEARPKSRLNKLQLCYSLQRLKTSEPFVPPKPNELLSA